MKRRGRRFYLGSFMAKPKPCLRFAFGKPCSPCCEAWLRFGKAAAWLPHSICPLSSERNPVAALRRLPHERALPEILTILRRISSAGNETTLWTLDMSHIVVFSNQYIDKER